jgi:hypothetical protein
MRELNPRVMWKATETIPDPEIVSTVIYSTGVPDLPPEN